MAEEKDVQDKVVNDIVGENKFKSRKFRSAWVAEAILTLFIAYGAWFHAESVIDFTQLLNVWVNFTLINIIGYGTANVAEKWVTLNKAKK